MVRQLQLTVIAALFVLAGAFLPAPAAACPRTIAGIPSTWTTTVGGSQCYRPLRAHMWRAVGG